MKEILQLLQSGEFYAVSEEIEIAKGKYEYQRSIRGAWNQFKRQVKWLLRK